MAGLVPAIHVFAASTKEDVDARQRRQVYAVCASLTSVPGMTKEKSRRTADADRRVYALLSQKILRQDARGRRRLQGHGQARALAAGAVRSRSPQEDGRRLQGLSADPVLPAATGRDLRQDSGPDRRADPPHQRRLCRVVRQGTRPFSRLGRADIARCTRCRRARGGARDQGTRRAWRADLHQRRRQTARPAAISAVLEKNERAGKAGLDAPRPRREYAGLYRREEVTL